MKKISNLNQLDPSFSTTMSRALGQMTVIKPKKRQIHILGRKKVTSTVSNELQKLGYLPICFETVKNLKAHTTGREGAIVYCSPLQRSEILSVHHNLNKTQRFKGMNYFAIVPEWLNSSTERRFYQDGIQVIFEWPRERSTFSQLFRDLLNQEGLSTKSDDSDKALRKAVEARLIACKGSINPQIDLSIYNGIVIARGNLKSIGAKNQLVHFIKNTPGVRGVVDQSLYVGAEMLPGLVKKKARQCLKESATIPEATLDIQVSPDERTLTLVGSTASVKTSEKAVRKLEKFKGVERVENRVNISPHHHARDLGLAKRGQNVIRKINMGSPHKVNLKVINGNAILRGTTSSTILLHQIENAIRNMDGIANVSNQIRINQSVPVNFY